MGPERRSDYYEVAYRALRMDADDRQRDPERYERIVNSAFLDMVRACEDTERDPPTGIAEALAIGAMATRELVGSGVASQSGVRCDGIPVFVALGSR